VIDYFRGKTLVCEQTKPRTYFTPVFQHTGDRLKLHHMEVDCMGYRQPKKMLPIEHMGKHKRRIFELEDENAKLRKLMRDVYVLCWHGMDCTECPWFDECDTDGGCPWLSIMHDHMHELGIEVAE